MASKKSDLYSSLWASCDQLRGGMDASQYKDYVLFMLFIKYISEDGRSTSGTQNVRWLHQSDRLRPIPMTVDPAPLDAANLVE